MAAGSILSSTDGAGVWRPVRGAPAAGLSYLVSAGGATAVKVLWSELLLIVVERLSSVEGLGVGHGRDVGSPNEKEVDDAMDVDDRHVTSVTNVTRAQSLDE